MSAEYISSLQLYNTEIHMLCEYAEELVNKHYMTIKNKELLHLINFVKHLTTNSSKNLSC